MNTQYVITVTSTDKTIIFNNIKQLLIEYDVISAQIPDNFIVRQLQTSERHTNDIKTTINTITKTIQQYI